MTSSSRSLRIDTGPKISSGVEKRLIRYSNERPEEKAWVTQVGKGLRVPPEWNKKGNGKGRGEGKGKGASRGTKRK